MGKGDRKTTKGKRYISSYGKARPQAAAKRATGAAPAPVAKKTATKSVVKAPRKSVAKKAAAK